MSRTVITEPIGGNGDRYPRQIRARLVRRAQPGGGTRLSVVVEERFYRRPRLRVPSRYSDWVECHPPRPRDLESIIASLMTETD